MAESAATHRLGEVAVLFADLAGFTAMTEAHGDDEAARAAIRLLELTHAAYDGQAVTVKSIGDGVMVVFDDLATAVSGALALSHAAHVEERFLTCDQTKRRALTHLGHGSRDSADGEQGTQPRRR